MILFASVFLQEAKRKAEIAQDKEKQERIDALVNDLLKASREKGLKAKEADAWTSRPLMLTFLPLGKKGESASVREGENEYIVLKLTSLFQGEGGVKVVEREILDKILQELKLSTTQLVDQETALKVGRILAARLIGTGSIVHMGSQTMLTLKFVETETTRVISAFSESIDQSNMDAVMKKIAQETISKLKKEFPLRGKITSIEGDTVTINIGSDEGIRKGLLMRVLGKGEGKEMGFVEITSVSPSQSQAKVIKKIRALAPGLKVEEQVEG